MTTPAEAMAVLGQLLEGTPLRSIRGAAPIAFELDGDAWSLDASRAQWVEPGAPAHPALTMRCSADLLLRLLTEPAFGLRAGEDLLLVGDPRPLEAVMEALRGGVSPLNARLNVLKRPKRGAP